MTALPIIAEASGAIDLSALSGWWELAKAVGPGATLAMGFGLWWMSRELGKRDTIIEKKDNDLKSEVAYGKDLTTKQLTVISELTVVIRAIDKRDSDSVTVTESNTTKILGAISDLKSTIIAHALGNQQQGRQAA